MTDTRQHILNTLAYFDIFHYPLNGEELRRFHGNTASQEEIESAINSLAENNLIFRIDDFFSLHDDPSLAERRKEGNRLAREKMKTAKKAARILSYFPYVKALAISGSLSKNFADENTDVDFFIITSANRLWFARTLMHLYYKLNFFTGRQRWFCMNYFVDEAGLEIEEKNIFTAIEITTLLPMYGKQDLENFVNSNDWIKHYCPVSNPDTAMALQVNKGWISRFIERMFSGRIGEWLDNYLMKVTEKRWMNKMKNNKKNRRGMPLGMVADKHCSKPNPVFFQNKVLEKYQAIQLNLPSLLVVSMKAV